MKKILFVAAVLALGFTTAQAQYDPRYDNRNDRHENDRDYNRSNRDYEPGRGRNSDIDRLQRQVREDISIGIRRGTLNSREASALMHQYDRIEGMQRKFSSRGRLSNRETRILTGELERLMADTNRMSSRRGDNWARGRNRY
jgi:hypothetical protein